MAPESRRIPVVDDDAATRLLVQSTVERAGYVAEGVASGREALERPDAGPDVAAVLLDAVMPGLDGLGTLRRIKTRHPRRPVIMLGARAETGGLIEAVQGGAHDCLPKPIEPDRVKFVLHHALRIHPLQERIHELECRLENVVRNLRRAPSPPGTGRRPPAVRLGAFRLDAPLEPAADPVLPAEQGEKRFISRALRIAGGNIKEAAAALGLSRTMLQRQLRKCGLRPDLD